MTLRSPGGTVVTLTTENLLGLNNLFNGTVWDDDADPDGQSLHHERGPGGGSSVRGQHTGAHAAPEEALGAFKDEDPNGTWTLTISDDQSGAGLLNEWRLEITTVQCPAATSRLATVPREDRPSLAVVGARGLPGPTSIGRPAVVDHQAVDSNGLPVPGLEVGVVSPLLRRPGDRRPIAGQYRFWRRPVAQHGVIRPACSRWRPRDPRGGRAERLGQRPLGRRVALVGVGMQPSGEVPTKLASSSRAHPARVWASSWHGGSSIAASGWRTSTLAFAREHGEDAADVQPRP